MRKVIITFLLILIVLPSTMLVMATPQKFFAPNYDERYESLKTLYYSSQYMIKKNPAIITDEALEAFAAGIFLKGLNPILIIHDQPPLGRYIFSLSILLFKNENTATIFLFVLSMVGIYLTGEKVLKNTVLSLIPVTIFANEPLMRNKLISTPLLEMVQLPFIVFSIYFFMRYSQDKKIMWAVYSALCLGGVISIRFFILGFVLLLSQILFLVIKRRINLLIRFIVVLPLSLLVLIVSYTRSIQESGSVLEPLRIQRYILEYHSSKFVQLFTVWDLLLFNRWHTWWGDRSITFDVNWIIVWPISSIAALCLAVMGIIKKTRLTDDEIILLLWVGGYLSMLSTGFVSVRYFPPLLPFLYILAIAFFLRFWIKKGKVILK